MKVLKNNSEKMRKVLEVEELMTKYGISLWVYGPGLGINIEDTEFRLTDVDNGARHICVFPRICDTERLELIENT